jgi:hypothetical protein
MELGNWETTKDLNPIYADIRRLGLEQNLAEHEAFGFTVVPPEKVAAAEFNRALLEAVLRVHADRTGEVIDPDSLADDPGHTDKPLDLHYGMLGDDPVFQAAVLNPAVYALARWFCGRSVLLSDFVGSVKRRNDTPTHLLHIDQSSTPPPLPQVPQFVNVTWPLTDYTAATGPIGVVPGSHRWGRGPMPHEEDFLNGAPIRPVPVLCKAGSLIVVGGTTWHCAFPRTGPGLRVTLTLTFCRSSMKPLCDYQHLLGPDLLAQNPPEFADLVGANALFPRRDRGKPDPEILRKHRAAGKSLWG